MTTIRKVTASLIAPLASPTVLIGVGWLQLASLEGCGPGCAGGVGPAISIWLLLALLTYIAFALVLPRAAKRLGGGLSLKQFLARPLKIATALSVVLAVFSFRFGERANLLADLTLVASPIVITFVVYGLWWRIAAPHNSAFQPTQ